MKLILKTAAVLVALFAIFAPVYAEIPDVSKWECPEFVVEQFPQFGIEKRNCFSSNDGWFVNAYLNLSGELIFVHEHRVVNDKPVYYNALKTVDGKWVEVLLMEDKFFKELLEADKGITLLLEDNEGKTVATRLIPFVE